MYFEKRDPLRNLARFYSLQIHPTLFGEWDVLRCWGRIGGKGRVLCNHHPDQAGAEKTVATLARRRLRHGYCRRT